MRRFEPAQHVQICKVPQNHVHGLRGEFRKVMPCRGEDAFSGGVRVAFDGGQHGQPLLGHATAVGTEGGSPCVVSARRVRHVTIEALIMTESQ
jgi:hypothetical protein